MNQQLIEQKLKSIFVSLFDVDPAKITTDSSKDDIPAWTSMQHLSLIVSIENEFQVQLTDEETLEMLSFGLITSILKDKLS